MLQAQSAYAAGPPSIQAVDGVAFGRILNSRLPEDRFDRQPLLGGGRFLLVADLRLDNRPELIASLGLSPGEGRRLSDADILLAAWLRWEASALERIVGDYAIAVFDRNTRHLSLARDPTGQRPLFYAQRDGLLGFATMPSGLLACPAFRRGFCRERLASMLAGVHDSSRRSDFTGIDRVMPGEVAEFAAGGTRHRRFWSPPEDRLTLGDTEYVGAYRAHLATAVAAQARRSAGLLGAQLSSGYDSSAVATTAAMLQPSSPLLAFTSAPREGFAASAPRGRLADESIVAAITARRHGMRHEVIRPVSGILSRLREHARLYQLPERNIVNMEWWTEANQRAHGLGVSTMLTGQMGNFTLNAGGLPALAEWIRQGALRRWARQAHAAGTKLDVRWRGVAYNSFDGFLPGRVRSAIDQLFFPMPSPAEQSFVRPEVHVEPNSENESAPAPHSGTYPSRRQIFHDIDHGLFRKGALAEFDIDERDPMSDRRIVEFSFRLPPEQLLDNGVSRPLARKALSDRVPAEVLDARLRGYQGADWHERLNREQAHGLLEEISTSHGACELLDLAKMRRAIDAWPLSGGSDLQLRALFRTGLLNALSTGTFLQEFEGSV